MRIEQKSPHACSQLAMAEASTSNSSESGSEFLPLQGWKASVWKVFGFEAREGEFVEADKRKRKEVTCVLCSDIAETHLTCAYISRLRTHLSLLAWSQKKVQIRARDSTEIVNVPVYAGTVGNNGPEDAFFSTTNLCHVSSVESKNFTHDPVSIQQLSHHAYATFPH